MSSGAYTGLLHTHRLVVTLFLLLYVAKLILLLINSPVLEKMRQNKGARIGEMVLSVLFLATGIALLTNVADLMSRQLLLIKIVAVLASIPLAVIGFKKSNKVLALLSVVLLIGSYGLAEMHKKSYLKPADEAMVYNTTENTVYGKQLYQQYCQNCHGEEGNLALSGAKNLQTSTLADEEVKNQILNGKGNMPAYKTILNEAQVEALLVHVKSLRK